MLRIFETGDNHIGLKYAKYENRQVLIDARVSAFQAMVQKAEKEKCDLFCITGDLFDRTNAARRDVRRVVEYLSSFHGTVVVLPGNHDYYDEEVQTWKYFIEETERVDNILLLKEYRPYEIREGENDIVIYPALCRSMHSLPGENNLGWIREEKIIPDHVFRIGMAHGAVEGRTIDNEGSYFVMSEKELNEIPVDVWLIGHTHVPFPASLKTDEYQEAGRIFNAGTHMQTDVNNHTEGDCFLIEIEAGSGQKKVRAEKYVSGPVRFYREEVNVLPGRLETAVESAVRTYGNNSVVELLLRGTANEEEYSHRDEIVNDCMKRFIDHTVSSKGLSRQITAEQIDREFPETSFSAHFLKALADDPAELQMAYEMIQDIRKGKAE